MSADSDSLLHALQTMMNAHGHGEVVLMSSSSQLFAVVADAYRRANAINNGDEIIILESAHEVCLSSRVVSPVSLTLYSKAQCKAPAGGAFCIWQGWTGRLHATPPVSSDH